MHGAINLYQIGEGLWLDNIGRPVPDDGALERSRCGAPRATRAALAKGAP